jgi:hypothetical protein
MSGMTISQVKEVETKTGVKVKINKYEPSGRYGVCVFLKSGKYSNPRSVGFRDLDRAEQYAGQIEREEAAKLEARQAKNEAKRKAREEFVNPAKVGDIYYTSWGYEQTNIDFFQVVRLTPKGVVFRKIAEDRKDTGWLQGTAKGIKDQFVGEEFRVNFSVSVGYDNKPYYSLPGRHSCFYQWDGREKGWSAYA